MTDPISNSKPGPNHALKFAPQPGIYLLSHSVGRPPASAREAVAQKFFQPWESGRVDVWDDWINAVGEFTSAVARLLNTSARQLCPQVNLSSALTKVLFSLPNNPARKTVLLTDNDFPSMGFVLDKARPAGYGLNFIGEAEDASDIDTWQKHLSDDVGLVFITHVHSNSSCQVPVAEITRLARARGIITVVDIAQSAGIIPIDLQQWQADFVIGSCVKWLCGGPGAGFLWLSEDMLATAEPIDVGWFSHEQPFEFDIHNFKFSESALRFWGGTPSVMPYVQGANSINMLADYGIDRIRRHNVELSQLIMDAAGKQHLESPLDPACRGGTVVVRYSEPRQERLAAALQSADVRFDGRAAGIRLSPHIYNSRTEVECVAGIIEGLK